MQKLTYMLIGFCIGMLVIKATEAQEEQLTYCQNSKGEVVIVSNFTCPKGCKAM